jgi:hypothetical protein
MPGRGPGFQRFQLPREPPATTVVGAGSSQAVSPSAEEVINDREVFVYGFGETETRAVILEQLLRFEALMPAGSLVKMTCPFSRANRGILEFADPLVRNQFLEWYHTLPEPQKLTYKGTILALVRQKSLLYRRKAAKMHECCRLLRMHLPAQVEVEAVPGRFVVLADAMTVAQLDRNNEEMAFDWQLLSSRYGQAVVASLRKTLE